MPLNSGIFSFKNKKVIYLPYFWVLNIGNMKKIIFSVLVIALSSATTKSVKAQAFEKGNINIDLGVGFGIYGTKQTQNFKLSIAGTTVLDQTNDTTDGALSFIIPIAFEYGITDKIGLGVDFMYSNYAISDTDRVNTESVKAIDFGAKFNYHLLKANKNDLMIGFGIGYSNMTWKFVKQNTSNAFESESAGGSGLYWTLGITDRIFFSDNIGMMFNVSYRGYSYSSIEYELTSEAEQILSAADAELSNTLKFDMNGVNVGLGLALKF